MIGKGCGRKRTWSNLPYLRVYKPHFFWQEFTLQNWGAAYARNIVLLTTEPATPVLYVVKIPVETASVWDCYLASYCTHTNALTYYGCIGIFWLHDSSRHHWFPEVGRPWHHWQITINAASDNQVPRMQSQIFYFHTGKIWCGLYTSYFQILDLII
jgi:hypothetical protein